MLPSKTVTASQQVSERLGTLAEATTKRVLPDLSKVGQQEAGGVIRTLTANLSAEVGKAATVAAVQSYQDMTDAALEELYKATSSGDYRIKAALSAEKTARHLEAAHRYDGVSVAELDKLLQREPKNVAARTARMWAARGFEGMTPKVLDVSKRVEKSLEGVVGNTMAKYTDGRFLDAENALSMGVNRMVQDVYRETISFNSQEDSFSSGYQRVASPLACAFCLVVALNEYTTFEESGGYHDHCNCSTVPIFRGVSAFEPDYYSGFREDYDTAFAQADGASADAILASVRETTGRK